MYKRQALGGRLRAVVVMRERTERALAMVAPYRSGRIGVAYDADGRIFDAFGVTYVSFGVLTDAKNRALWMGNTLRITPDFIEQTVQ